MPPNKDSEEGKKKKKKNTSLRLERDMLKQLKHKALEEDTSVQEIIERLIREYLEGTPPSRRRSR